MRKENLIIGGAALLLAGGAILVLKEIDDRVKKEGEAANAYLAPAGPSDKERSWLSRFFWGSADDSYSPAGVVHNVATLWGSPSSASTNDAAAAPQSAPFGYNPDGTPKETPK